MQSTFNLYNAEANQTDIENMCGNLKGYVLTTIFSLLKIILIYKKNFINWSFLLQQ